jgi:uncharacterized protein (DUF924 family)
LHGLQNRFDRPAVSPYQGFSYSPFTPFTESTMHTEHLHQTLSPQAYAALLDDIHRRARLERRRAVQRFGRSWPTRLRALVRSFVAHRAQGVSAVRLMEG